MDQLKSAIGLHQALKGIIDYAGLFPPAGLADVAAAAEFLEQRAQQNTGFLMHRFVMPLGSAGRVAGLLRALAQAPDGTHAGPIALAGLLPQVVLANAPGQPQDAQSIKALLAPGLGAASQLHEIVAEAGASFEVESYEWSLPIRNIGAELWPMWCNELAEALRQLANGVTSRWLYVESDWRLTSSVDLVFQRIQEIQTSSGVPNIGLKIRTGGLTKETIPPDPSLAALICGAVDHGIAFKCTAGLHSALHEQSPRFGFEMHGFGNVLAATAAKVLKPSLSIGDCAAILRETSRVGIEERFEALAGQTLHDSVNMGRGFFRSFGSCSVVEPLESLVAHGMWVEQS
jgi:hypothetical protein